jgi:cell division transport system permease protein
VQQSKTRKKLGSYPSFGVVISIMLALFVTGLFGLLITYTQELERIVRANVQLEIYLKNGLTETQRLQVQKRIESMAFINSSISRDSAINFVSKEQAAKNLLRDTGEDFTTFFDENPLHEAYVIKVDPSFHTDSAMLNLKADLEKMNGINEVAYVPGLLQRVNKNTTTIGLILSVIVALLLITVVLMINNTLRLALFSQRFLVRSMQLVGARKWFIQRPFILRASFHGFLAGLLACGGILLFIRYSNQLIEDLTTIQNQDRIILLCISLIITGVIIAVTSSYFAIRKYLRMSLDELY